MDAIKNSSLQLKVRGEGFGVEGVQAVTIAAFGPEVFRVGFDCPFGVTASACGISAERRGADQIQRGAITDSLGSLTFSANPARSGEIYTMWLSGMGNPGVRGDLRSRIPFLRLALRDVPTGDPRFENNPEILFAGHSEQFPGLDQINFRMPSAIGSGPGPCRPRKLDLWLSISALADGPVSSKPIPLPLDITGEERPCLAF